MQRHVPYTLAAVTSGVDHARMFGITASRDSQMSDDAQVDVFVLSVYLSTPVKLNILHHGQIVTITL